MNDYNLEQISAQVSTIQSELNGMSFMILILLVVVSLGVFNGSNNTAADYFQFCNKTEASPQDCTSWSTGMTRYYVNETSQQVQFVDISPVPSQPFSLSGCTVANADNWYCTDTGAGGGFGYQKGVVEDGRPFINTGITKHLDSFQYWWYKLTSFV